ncbi:MAG: hypothetical protein IJ375_06835 [Oscillospiraceae bacterium]|nr:hypothetical protein [Oscillospiraceae bacterium]
MGQTIVSKVIDALTRADIRADEAYPGSRIPALTGPVAAVRLGKVDRSVRTTAVQIVVMSPAGTGGSVCEATALRAVDTLQDMGATCVKEICKFDEMADVFYIEISAAFFGTPGESSWSAGPGYSITIGAQAMEHVTGFAITRKTDEEVTSIGSAKWQFTLEELLPPGTSEPADPSEPFTITVARSGGEELLSGCTWTSARREDTLKGIGQTRTGVATGRSVMGIL